MIAEDTVIDKLLAKARLLDPHLSADRERYIAEISFGAGREQAIGEICKPFEKHGEVWYREGKAEGRGEVVEWADKYCPHRQGISGIQNMSRRYCEDCWQAQKKEWGC